MSNEAIVITSVRTLFMLAKNIMHSDPVSATGYVNQAFGGINMAVTLQAISPKIAERLSDDALIITYDIMNPKGL